MASLTLNFVDGSSESRDLSRSQPLTIGGHAINDICLAESEVAPFHCRISWNKSGFEITAATPEGVEVNSNTVAHADLRPGDVIRVGSLDLIFQDDSTVAKKHRAPPVPDPPVSRKSKSKPERAPVPVEDMSLYSGVIPTQSEAMIDMMFAEEDLEDDDEAKTSESKKSTMPGGILGRPVRPGEQEVLKSPLVLGLTFGGLTLLLVTGIFWFLMSREQSNRQYERAVKEMNDGQFAQAATSFEQFIAQNPSHGLRRQADRGLAKTLVQKEIAGSTPSWKRGLERMHELIKAHRTDSDFSELHSSLFQFAEQISLGAAKSAETARDPELMVISKEAQTLMERYADPSAPPTGTIARINEQRVKSDRAIDKQKTFDLAMKSVGEAIADRKPMVALAERERLVKTFPEFVGTKRVREALQKSLDLERSVVSVDETEQAAETTDEPPSSKEPILGLLQARSRADEVSRGQVVFAMAKDSCYAIDAVTGELVWRRVVGLGSPFFPVLTNGSQPAVLLFDTRKLAVLACQLTSGKLIWKQTLKARAIGTPLIHEGQIYLSLQGNSLVRMDVDTGRISSRVRFSQELAASPALSHDGDYVFVPGEMSIIYTLGLRTTASRQPLAAVATTFTDHSAGSITAAPLSMGRLLLLCENDLADSARLRLWDASKPTESLTELASTRTDGQVRDVPVLRGNQLVVPSAGEKFAAFIVTDDSGRAGIAPIGQYSASAAGNLIASPLYVAIGSDNQFWSAGSAFRKFEIGSGNIRMEANSVAPGIASQRLQLVGDQFFVGRKSRISDAVTFSAVDREKMVIPWRCIVGDSPLEMISTRDGGIVWVSESGTLYTVGKNRMTQGGIDLKAGRDLELPANVSKPIRATAISDQRLVVAAAGDIAEIQIVNASGQVVGKYPIGDLPETDPVLLDDGLVLPLPSRLKLLPLSPGKKPAQDWIAPVGENLEHRWNCLVRVDGKELIACNRTGRLARIQFRQGDVPHLAEVAKLQLDQPFDVRPVFRGDFLYVADAGGTFRQLNVHSFDTDGQRALVAPIKNVWLTGSTSVVHSGDRTLRCLADGKGLPELWSFDLKDLDPIGSVITRDDSLWIACRNGTILVLNPGTGAELRRIVVPQSLSLGLRLVNELVVAVALDGTLYRLE